MQTNDRRHDERKKMQEDKEKIEQLYDIVHEDVPLLVFYEQVNLAEQEDRKRNLNRGQRVIFEYVMEKIEGQEDRRITHGCDLNLPCIECDQEEYLLRLFVTGEGKKIKQFLYCFLAGTGKSHLINIIKSEIYVIHAEDLKIGKLRVSITAPTGLAASGLKGYTIHSLFSMDFYHGGEAEYNALRGEKLEQLKSLFQKRPSLLIIDEISMVSNVMLMKVHARLCEILGTHDLGKL